MEDLLTESQSMESEKGIAGHEFDDIWEMFGSSGSRRSSESKDAQMDDFNTDLFSFISSMQEEGSSDGLDGDGTALTVEEKRETDVCMPSGSVSEAEVPPVSVAGVHK